MRERESEREQEQLLNSALECFSLRVLTLAPECSEQPKDFKYWLLRYGLKVTKSYLFI